MAHALEESPRIRNPGPWRLSPPLAAALEGALMRPVVAAGPHLCANARVAGRHMGVGEGRSVPADVEGLATEIRLRFGMTRVHRVVHFAQFWHGEHARRFPARRVFTIWVCLYGDVRVFAECAQAGRGQVLCRNMTAGHMILTEPSDSVTVSVPHFMRDARSPVWLAAVFSTRHDTVPAQLHPVPAHVVLSRTGTDLCNTMPLEPERHHGIFFVRMSGVVARVTVPGAELEVELVTGDPPDHPAVDDECSCCPLRPYAPRSRVLSLVELCRGATVMLTPPISRGSVGVVAQIRLPCGRCVRVRALRSLTGGRLGPQPTVVWTGVFVAATVMLGGSVPTLAACVDAGRALYGLVFVPEGEPRMESGVTTFPTPQQPVAMRLLPGEAPPEGAFPPLPGALGGPSGENGGGGRDAAPAASGAAAAVPAHALAAEGIGVGRRNARDDSDDEAPVARRPRLASSDSDSSDSSSSTSSSTTTSEDEEDFDSDSSWGVSSSDSGIEHDDGGAGQMLEEAEEEEAERLRAAAALFREERPGDAMEE
ncbi:hypothetical protein SB87_gp122 [Parapoxvirus red deer/HL953]|uniref:Uncharacterized protein n=1 Tax=Parapoxvirus red deer/HL953 TaxID=1579460 RepID=A0A0A7M9U8_9POXV|nr:hypothetical protein SB87_gp122 [Parapoxvirus red deer/HL953]AIZ77375.1 hypothetical protein [Parapoxvirus red deer/HL953]